MSSNTRPGFLYHGVTLQTPGTASAAPARRALYANLVVIFLTRSFVNTAYRALYPFLPLITRDLGITLETGGILITLRNLIGLSAPLFGPLSDRYGRVHLMIAGLILLIIGCFTIGVSVSLLLVALALGAITLGKTIYDPAMQAYLGDRVPYAERGRAMAFAELSWSSAGLLGLPLAGWLISVTNWRSPFVGIAIFCSAAVFLTWRGLERVSPHAYDSADSTTWKSRVQLLVANPTALAALLASLLMAAGNENINVVYATWADQLFHLDAFALGLVAGAIGFAELVGELLSSGFVDWLGKKRAVTIGLVLAALTSAMLPFFNQSVWALAVGLFAMYLTFEFALVCSLPVITEIIPSARGALISFNVAAFLLGRAAGAFMAPFVFSQFGFMWNGFVSTAITLIAVSVWQTFVKEHRT